MPEEIVAASGFTDVVLNAHSNPTIDNSSAIHSIKAKNSFKEIAITS